MAPLTSTDRLEIQELVSRYNWADDTADGEAFAATFTPQGVFEGGSHHASGHDELVALGNSVAPRRPAGCQHWVTNLVLEGNDQTARMKCYFALHRVDEQGRIEVRSLGYYVDDVAKTPNGWLFARRTYRRWPPAEGGA